MKAKTMSDPKDILKALGVDPDEALVKYQEHLNKKPERHICTCGHAKARHYIAGEVATCKPSALECPCNEYNPVIEVQDTRSFLHSTQGPGIEHALIKGLTATLAKGTHATWLPGAYRCRICGSEEELTVYPIGGNKESGLLITKEIFRARWNFLLCPTCAEKMS